MLFLHQPSHALLAADDSLFLQLLVDARAAVATTRVVVDRGNASTELLIVLGVSTERASQPRIVTTAADA